MSLPSASVRRPVFTTMVTLMVVTIGGVALTRLRTDLLPDVEMPTVTIRTEPPEPPPVMLPEPPFASTCPASVTVPAAIVTRPPPLPPAPTVPPPPPEPTARASSTAP